jgi:hypothetical protein
MIYEFWMKGFCTFGATCWTECTAFAVKSAVAVKWSRISETASVWAITKLAHHTHALPA